ncbi:MAG: inorganic diphosphatase [bacterium]
MRKILIFASILLLHFGFYACGNVAQQEQNTQIDKQSKDKFTLIGEKSFLTGYEPVNTDGTINIVVEIPTGTTAKWEVTKPDGIMKWEFKNSKPRVVKYLGYPGNYGMIPKTLLPEELGGDGDPLDVILLGDALPRGSVAQGRLVGVLKLLDSGEQDDKLIAISHDSPLASATSMEELQERYPSVLEIVELWFSNYKGRGVMESKGFGDQAEAEDVLHSAIAAFKQH